MKPTKPISPTTRSASPTEAEHKSAAQRTKFLTILARIDAFRRNVTPSGERSVDLIRRVRDEAY